MRRVRATKTSPAESTRLALRSSVLRFFPCRSLLPWCCQRCAGPPQPKQKDGDQSLRTAEVNPPVDPSYPFDELDHQDREPAKQIAAANNAKYVETLCEGVVRAVFSRTMRGRLTCDGKM